MGVVLLSQEIIPEWRNMRECVEDHVCVVVGLDVVQADDAGIVEGAVPSASHFRIPPDCFDVFSRVCGFQDVLKSGLFFIF